MKVLCAVVLISLLGLVAALDCGSNGVQDTYAKSMCSCFSGFAPSSASQSDCDVYARCPSNEPIDTRTSVGGFPPQITSATLKADRYNLVVAIPLVNGRRNATVRFAGGSPSCGYPGNLWVKTSNTLDCIDELKGSLPWSSNGMCGFKKSVSGIRTTFSAGVLVTYDDLIVDSEGSVIRTVGSLLKVNVTFATQTTVVFSLFDLNLGNTFVTVSIVGNLVYDANTGLATVVIQTKATWPYTVVSIVMTSTPTPTIGTLYTDTTFNLNAAAGGCTNATGSTCYQQYIMVINPNAACDLGGVYVFNATIGCRGPGSGACGGVYKVGAYGVRIYSTDVCGGTSTDNNLSNGNLLPFSDPAGTIPAANYLPNSIVYFVFSIVSESVTLDSLTIAHIEASTDSSTDVLYELNPVGANVSPGLTALGKAASLQTGAAVVPVPAGTAALLTFQVTLVDAVPSFRVLPTEPATVKMSIVVELSYHGVTRREVYTAEAVSAAMATGSSMGRTNIYISADTETSTPTAQITNSATQVFSFVSLLFTVIFMLF